MERMHEAVPPSPLENACISRRGELTADSVPRNWFGIPAVILLCLSGYS